MNWSNEVNKKIIDMFADELKNKNKNYESYKLICKYKPNSLFKFKRFRDDYENIIINGKNFTLSKKSEFEDIAECELEFDWSEKNIGKKKKLDYKDQARLLLNPQLNKKFCDNLKENNEDAVKNNFNNFYIGCLTVQENLNSVEMWDKYAFGSTGYCLEYDFWELNKSLSEAEMPLPVFYSDEVVMLDPCCIEPNIILKCIFHKKLKWKFEREWRILLDKDKCGNEKIDKNTTILFKKVCQPKAVYFGCNISELNKGDDKGFVLTTKNFEKLIHDCKQNNIKVYQMYMENEKLFYFEI